MIEIENYTVKHEEWPSSADELSQVLKAAWTKTIAVAPIGGGTKLHLGNPLRAADLAVHTSHLRGITEYEPDNMTVSVLAGTPLHELQDALRKCNQFLPLDPPRPAEATVAGLVACNTSGPIRLRYGTIRDLLIGVKIVHADGTLTKAGGKLVKNVTGYDMCKLYTGSLGTLGILSELTFKVQPRPDTLASVLLSFPSVERALEATRLFIQADLLPDALEVWNGKAYQPLSGEQGSAPWVLMVRFGEFAQAVQWQINRLKELLPRTGGELLRTLGGAESEAWWDRAASARELTGGTAKTEEAVIKCSVLYESVAETIRRMEELGKRLDAQLRLYCHAGDSVIYARYEWSTPGPARDKLREELAGLRRLCAAHGGHAVVEKIRPELKVGFDVWGYDAPALEIMRRIKRQFDPRGILNPGRFVGGI